MPVAYGTSKKVKDEMQSRIRIDSRFISGYCDYPVAAGFGQAVRPKPMPRLR
jgi:hypothetical protein